MLKPRKEPPIADPYSAASLIRRLLSQYAVAHWRAYLGVLAMMGVIAASTAALAYLIGHAVNEAYVSKNIASVVLVCIAITPWRRQTKQRYESSAMMFWAFS